jgi:hypothetical protein
MVRIFAEFFYHSHSSLKQLHDQSLLSLRQQVVDVASKWQQKILPMPFEDLRSQDFLDRVRRSAEYFEGQLRDILAKPIELSAKVETNNKQAAHRLGVALPDLRQMWLARRYLLAKVAANGFSVDSYLREKQMSMLDALSEDDVKPKNHRKPKLSGEPKVVKPKTWEVSFQMYQQGMKPDLIAHERGLTLSTVIGHLSRYLTSGEVAFHDLVSPEHQQTITRLVERVGVENGLSAIKNLCPADVTYDEIRLVVELINK